MFVTAHSLRSFKAQSPLRREFSIPLAEACWFSFVAVSATNEKGKFLCVLCDLAMNIFIGAK